MKLHETPKLFSETIRAASQYLNIKDEFVEKDYWITLVLNRLANSNYAADCVFKGGTSLSKGFELIERFSEDVDIAIISDENKTGNEIKTIIRNIEKEITAELKELIITGVTSKGSRFRKSVFVYPSIDSKNTNNKLIVEVNSFANPFPFNKLRIKSFVYDFLLRTGNEKYIHDYFLEPIHVNVLDKEQTLLEKLVALIRVSFEENAIESISKKIRHFYDLYFLIHDTACSEFIKSDTFKKQFETILQHDKEMFDEPIGWKSKGVQESPLFIDFEKCWVELKGIYKAELSALAYSPIPNEKDIEISFSKLLEKIK